MKEMEKEVERWGEKYNKKKKEKKRGLVTEMLVSQTPMGMSREERHSFHHIYKVK